MNIACCYNIDITTLKNSHFKYYTFNYIKLKISHARRLLIINSRSD